MGNWNPFRSDGAPCSVVSRPAQPVPVAPQQVAEKKEPAVAEKPQPETVAVVRTPEEALDAAEQALVDGKFKRAIGAPDLFGEAGYSTLERLWARPTFDINGIWGGFMGEGAKTVIPAVAHAKISMRLVPDQRPADIATKATRYLKKIAPPSVRVTVDRLHGGEAWLAPTDHPALAAAGRAVKRAFGKTPVLVREGGSIPIIASFSKILKVPSVLMGIGLNDDNLHAPNEKMELDNFYRGNAAAAFLMEELGNSH